MRIKDFQSVTGKKYDSMLSRCYREKDASFKHYSKRGIKVCSAWIHNIETFREWVALQLLRQGISQQDFIDNSKRYQLDRIDTMGHYAPDNCCFLSPQANSRNRRGISGRVIISAEGEEIIL